MENNEKKKEQLNALLSEIYEKGSYDILEFKDYESEKAYLEKKTEKYDVFDHLVCNEDSDGIVIITEDKTYAVYPVFIHDNAFAKIFKFIYHGEKHFYKPDVIEYYNNLGNVLIRVTNNNGIKGFDSYIPEKLNDYQIRKLSSITRDLNRVYKEYEDIDDMNANNIKYGIRTIRDSISENRIVR